MAGIENLFATEPTLPNVQRTKMPDNPEKWAEVMTTLMREQFPDIAKLAMTVNFKKKDDQQGTAIGAVHVVSIEAAKSVFIPFVIEKFQLYPLDVWMEAKTQAVHPLTKDTFKELFFVQNFAEGLDVRPTDATGQYFNDPSMWTTTYPPLQGRYSYASAGYHILDQVADTMSEADLNEFRNVLKSEPMLLSKFEKRGHKEIIQKLAAMKGKPMTNDFAASAKKLIPTSVIQLRREGTDKYSLLSSGLGMFDLADHVHVDRENCMKFLSRIVAKPENFMNEVDQAGEKMEIMPVAPKRGVWMFDPKEVEATDANEFTCYWVKNNTGLLIDAVVIPDVVDYAGKRVKGRVVLSKTHSCFQDRVAGVKYPESGCLTSVLKPVGTRTGQMGTFVYIGENGKAIATVPVTIKAIENDSILDVVDVYGRKMRIRHGWASNEFRHSSHEMKASLPEEKVTTTLESLGFVELKEDYMMIPSRMMWIPMEPMTDVMATPSEWMEKVAAAKMDMDPVTVRYTGIVYEFTGNGLPKIAASEDQAKHLLANMGADLTKIAQIMKKAKQVGKAKVHGCAKLESRKDVEGRVKEAHAKVAAACKSMRTTLVKQAAEIDNQATVDTILSLNFMNPDNLAKFVSYVPVFEKCTDFLAELTLSSRLGLKQIDQGSTTTAMQKVLEVLEGLKKIEASMKKPTSKLG